MRSDSRPATQDPAATSERVSPRRDAVRDVLALAPGLFPLGVTLGVVIAASVMGKAAGLLGAPLVYGGSAQLTATTLFQHGAGLLVVVGSALIVNARLMLYGASLAHRFRGQPRWFQLVGPHFIVDQTYLSAAGRPAHRDGQFRRYWLFLGLGVMAVWTAAVGTGLLLGPRLPSLPHLPLVGIALFIGMLMPRLRDAPGVAAAVSAAVAAPVAAQLVPGAGVVAGAAAGMIAGLMTSRKSKP
jgi:predicted branched-subunit amino acid permease